MGRRQAPPGPRSQTIGNNIRAAREAAGFTQGQLAQNLGWTHDIVVNLEKARTNCRVEQLLDLADVLGVKPAKLLDGA